MQPSVTDCKRQAHGILMGRNVRVRLLCHPLSPRVCSDSCPLRWWCYLTTLSSVTPSPFAFNLSQHQVLLQWVSHIRWQKYWIFSFSISPSNKYSGLISFSIDWFLHWIAVAVSTQQILLILQFEEETLDKEKAVPKLSLSSTFAWEIPWTEEPGRLQSMGSRRVRLDWATSLSLFTFMHWRRKWQPTPVLLPGESQGREPGGMPSMGSHRVRHDWRDLAAAANCLCQFYTFCPSPAQPSAPLGGVNFSFHSPQPQDRWLSSTI